MPNFFSKFFNKSKDSDDNNDMRRLQAKLNKEALATALSYKIKLDYSDGSIVDVETMLDNLHKHYLKTGKDMGLRGLAVMFGFYIMSVVEKNHGVGTIERDHDDFGANTFPFFWQNSTLFPCAWCFKRIFDGPADDVWVKYRLTVLNHQQEG